MEKIKNILQRRKIIFFSGLVLLCVYVTAPVIFDIIPLGHDIRFHMHRIAGMAQALADGCFPVRLQPGWYHDFGYPLGVFYGDLFLYPSALLYLAGVPLHACYRLLLLSVVTAAVFVSFLCFRCVAKNSHIGFFACFLYSGSMWFLTDLYVRAAIGEAMAMVFLPLLVLGVTQYLRGKNRQSVFVLAAGLTGLIQSHVITAVLSAVALVVFRTGYMLVLAKRRQTGLLKKTFFAGWCTFAGTFCANAGFLVPFADYNLRYDIVAHHRGMEEVFAGAEMSRWFLLDYSAYGKLPEHDGAGVMPLTVGLALLSVLFTGLVLTAFNIMKKQRQQAVAGVLLIAASLLLLLLTTSRISTSALHAGHPVLYFLLYGWLQFPFRYNTVITVLLCVLFIRCCRTAKALFSPRATCMIAGCMLFLSIFEGIYLMSMFSQGYTLGAEQTAADVGPHGDELYLFEDIDPQSTANDQTYLRFADADTITRQGFSFLLEDVTALREGAYIEMPLWLYYGYRAEDGDGNEILLSEGTDHRIRIDLPEGFRGNLSVAFREPWYWRAAEILSFVGAAAAFCLAIRRKSHSRIQFF